MQACTARQRVNIAAHPTGNRATISGFVAAAAMAWRGALRVLSRIWLVHFAARYFNADNPHKNTAQLIAALMPTPSAEAQNGQTAQPKDGVRVWRKYLATYARFAAPFFMPRHRARIAPECCFAQLLAVLLFGACDLNYSPKHKDGGG